MRCSELSSSGSVPSARRAMIARPASATAAANTCATVKRTEHARVDADEFQTEPERAGEKQIAAEHLPIGEAPTPPPDQHPREDAEKDRFVDLRRMDALGRSAAGRAETRRPRAASSASRSRRRRGSSRCGRASGRPRAPASRRRARPAAATLDADRRVSGEQPADEPAEPAHAAAVEEAARRTSLSSRCSKT